jgi:hypothetical protein
MPSHLYTSKQEKWDGTETVPPVTWKRQRPQIDSRANENNDRDPG